MTPSGVLGYHETIARVRFGQVDRYGMLWHGHAPALFEAARADIARRFGLGVPALLELNLTAPMVEIHCEYKQPAFEDEELITQSSLLKPPMRTPFVTFFYRVAKVEGSQEVLRGRTRQLIMQQDGKTFTRLPDAVQERLEALWDYLGGRPRWTLEQTRELAGERSE